MAEIDVQKLPEFDDHKLIACVFEKEAGLKGYIAIHRTRNNFPSLGATRLWHYENETDAIKDVLRLSRLMSYKSALAGLPYGGAKAVLIATPKAARNRRLLFQAYAQKINYFCGKFITGTDVGVTDEDVKLMRKSTPYVIGTQVDPAYYTAVSVVEATKILVSRILHKNSLTNLSFAIQGLGKTGLNVLKNIYHPTNTFFVADIDAKKIKIAKKLFPKIKFVKPGEIHKQKVDIFVPCALSGVLNTKNVSELKCKIISGSANNQLENNSIGDPLHKLGIFYAPDYITNAGGLIAVSDELKSGRPSEERILDKINNAKNLLEKILDLSQKQNRPTSAVANEMAEKIFNHNKSPK